MEAEAEILEPLELHYSDLLLLSSPSTGLSPPSPEELERLMCVSDRVMEALGPSGPGLLCVTGVPKAPAQRRVLLPLARKLALLGNSDRARILKPAWEKTLSIPENIVASEKLSQELTSNEETHTVHSEKSGSNFLLVTNQDGHNLKEEILKAVPPLCSRLRDGMTFAEFSRQTTKQYYVGSGTQSRC